MRQERNEHQYKLCYQISDFSGLPMELNPGGDLYKTV